VHAPPILSPRRVRSIKLRGHEVLCRHTGHTAQDDGEIALGGLESLLELGYVPPPLVIITYDGLLFPTIVCQLFVSASPGELQKK
jgi:hypothetical protein